MASRGDDRFPRAVERWIARYRRESESEPDEHKISLLRDSLSALPGFDTTAIGADTLAQAA